MILITTNHKDTLALGERLARSLRPSDIVLLYGDLGAGKTALAQGICKGLGVATKYICSPTFTLINEYIGNLPIYHIDLYRLNYFSEIEALGLEEYLFSKGISIIEWAEKLFPESNKKPGLGIDQHIDIYITFEEENHRNIRIELVNQKDRSIKL